MLFRSTRQRYADHLARVYAFEARAESRWVRTPALDAVVDLAPRLFATRLADDLAPDWPQPVGHSGYRVVVTGNPNYTCDVQMMGDDGDHNTGGLVGTAARIINAIPAVCAAEPGLLSVLDLPLIPGAALRARTGT